MLVEYYFKIKYIKGTNNTKINVFNRKVELQKKDKGVKGDILKMDNNKKIKYNYL